MHNLRSNLRTGLVRQVHILAGSFFVLQPLSKMFECSLYCQLLQVVDWFHTAFIHTASHGDGFVEAPNVELIEPKVEPLSEEIKYRLFDLSILEADIHLLEGDAITRIQVSLTSCLILVP